MKIIFEGIDTAGKGTIISLLSELLKDYEVLRGSSFELTHGKTEDELYEAFNSFVDMGNIILDRYMYSNIVYAPLYDDYAQLTHEDLKHLEHKLWNDAIVVYLYADESVIKERFISRGEEYVSEDKISKILTSYQELMDDSHLYVLEYNTGKLSPEQIVTDIVNYIKVLDKYFDN